MSTKTTFKRVALVAVAALGLGVLSVAPSSAVSQADSLTLSATTAAQTTAETRTATSAVATLSFISENSGDTVSVTASLVSGPATNVALPVLGLIETVTTTVVQDSSGTSRSFPYAMGLKASVSNSSSSATLTTAKFAVYIAAAGSAPTLPGTYVVKLTPAIAGGSGTLNATAQTLTITVTEDSGLATVASPSLTTSVIAAGETTTPAVAGIDDVVAVAKTISTNAAAMILVTQANAAGKGLATSPASAGESLTVIITGPGSIATVAASADMTGITKTGARALTLVNGQVVGVFADGSAGTATITFTNSAGTVIATETVTFYSTVVAKLTAKTIKSYVLAGGATNADGGATGSSSVTNTRVFLVNAFDADGRDMASGAGTITVTPTSTTTDALIGAAGVCTYKDKTTLTAAGYYCSAPGVSAAKFGKVNYTFAATLADGTTKVTTTADTTFADKEIAKFTVTGPATANVGDLITLTFTATDKNGYPVADLSYEGAAGNGAIWDSVVRSNAAFVPFAVGETITTVAGVATTKVYVPATAGKVTSTWTTTGTAGTASGALAKTLTETDVVYTVTVASEALDAANAATTAALAANDAVDALAATVAKLVANLKAQITALTKLIVKIQKKVGA